MCCDTKRRKTVARNPLELRPVLGGRHALLATRLHAARTLRPLQRLAHDNFTKAQAAGLQLN